MIIEGSHRWPPEHELAYFGSPSFVEHVRSETARLHGRYPTWAEDAVFDTVADLIERVCADNPKKEPIHLREFPAEISFLAFVSVACKRRAIDWLKKGRRESVRDEPLLAAAMSRESPPEGSLAAKDFLENVKKFLPEAERQVVVFHYLMGYSEQEIATRLGRTRGRVSKVLRRAIARLRRRLGAE